MGLGLGHLIQGGRHSVELEEAVVDPVASDAAYSQARVEGVAGDGRHVDTLHELEDGLRGEHLCGMQAGHGAQGMQAGDGAQRVGTHEEASAAEEGGERSMAWWRGGVAVACGGFDQLMTPPAAPVVTTSVPACVRAMHEAW